MGTYNENRVVRSILCLRLVAEKSDDLVALAVEVDTLHTGRSTTHRPYIRLFKSHTATFLAGNEQLAAAACKGNVKKLVPFADGEGNDTIGTRS